MTETIIDDLFHLTWRQERADWAAYEALERELSGREKWLLVLPVFGLGAAYEWAREDLARMLLQVGWIWAGGLAATIVLVLVYAAIAILIATLQFRRRVAQRLIPATDTVLVADPQHLTITQDGATTYHAWELLQVIETPQHVFLRAGPTDVIVVPRRAFERDADMHIFAHAAKDLGRYWVAPGDTKDEAAKMSV